MASNPLFQRSFRTHEAFYPKHLHNLEKDRFQRPMERQASPGGGNRRNDGSRKRETGSKQEPQTKRQRVEPAGADDDGDWDDIELTQQDLDTLDVIASQAAIETSKHEAALSHVDPDQTLPLERDMPTHEHTFQRPGPSGALRTKSSTSSSSDSSMYPISSTSFSKTLSSDASSAAGSLTSKSDGSHSSDRSLGDASVTASSRPGSSLATAPAVREELNRKAEEARKLHAELERTRREMDVRDGRVKFLNDLLHKQEAELEKLRADREERQEQEQDKQKERERELRVENERLQTQIQFLTQDVKQLQDRYHAMEQRVPQIQISPAVTASGSNNTSASTPLATSTPGSPSKSPKRRKVPGTGAASRTPEKGAFPSRRSFMAGPCDAVASTSRVELVHSTKDAETMTTGTETNSTPMSLSKGVPRRLKLSVAQSKAQTTGSQVVSQLLQCSCSADGEVNDSGLMGLVQMLPSRLDLSELRYERDSATSRLSPVKKLRSLELRRQSLSSGLAARPIVSKENFLLAVQGLRHLLESPRCEQKVSANISDDTHGPQELEGSVLLLPLLNDYMSHYIDILTSSSNPAGVSSPNLLSSDSSKSASSESSLESLTSSLGMLLQAGAEYANSMETLTLCTLRVLHKLVCLCAHVRSVFLTSRLSASFLQPATDTSSSSVETGQDKEKTSESGMEGDDEQSTSISSASISSLLFSPEHSGSPSARLQGLNILHKVVRLASPSHEGSGYNPLIVQEALHVLTSLAVKSEDSQVDRLNLVILRGVVTECLSLDQQHAITMSALKLFAQLVRARSVVLFLCTKSDSCTLLHVHMAAIKHLRAPGTVDSSQSLCIIDQVISSLFSVVRHHRNGVTILADNNCRCSGQIVPSLVHSLSHLLQQFQISQNPEIMATFRRGVLLLHNLSMWDMSFQFHCSVVSMYYTSLMSALARVYRTAADLPSNELLAMEELWDEEDADSQDSDQDEAMEAT